MVTGWDHRLRVMTVGHAGRAPVVHLWEAVVTAWPIATLRPWEGRGATMAPPAKLKVTGRGWCLLPCPGPSSFAWLEASRAEPPLPTVLASPGSLHRLYYLIHDISVLILKADLN